VVELLIQAGADVNAGAKKVTALHWAVAFSGGRKIAQSLINAAPMSAPIGTHRSTTIRTAGQNAALSGTLKRKCPFRSSSLLK